MTLKERCQAAIDRLNTEFPSWWQDKNALDVSDTAALIAGASLADERELFMTAKRLIKMAEDRIDADLTQVKRIQGLSRP